MRKKRITDNIYLMYYIVLIPLIIFGLYKNGIELYQKGYVDILNMLKPLIMILMSVSGALIGSFIREYKKTKSKRKAFNNCHPNIIYSILLVSILPLRSSPLILFFLTLIMSLFIDKTKFNKVALMFLIAEGLNTLFNLNNFYNAYQINTELNYDGLDLFWGLGSGGTFSTSILLTLIGLFILSFNKIYKKEVAYSSLLTFSILGTLLYMIKGEYRAILPYLFSYNIMFSLVFIAPITESTPYTVKGQLTSGIIIGILVIIITFFWPNFAAPIAILVISIIKNIIDRLFVIK